MNNKRKLGQFNTTQADYILSGFEGFLKDKNVIDPFAGEGDLLKWNGSGTGYDVDDSKGWTVRDTLINPPSYEGSWVITNPPFLARNKNPDKTIYDLYGLDDLYKCAIKSIIGCEGGILIVPVNFISSEQSKDIRDDFFSNYKMLDCKVFEESVFDDTDYTVCAFTFIKAHNQTEASVPVVFWPLPRGIVFNINKPYGWIFGEKMPTKSSGIGRFTLTNCIGEIPKTICVGDPNTEKIVMNCDESLEKNIVLLRAIDTGTVKGRIGLMDVRELGIDGLIGKATSRGYAHIKFDDPLSIEDQLRLIKVFNERLEFLREKYNSIFLTAFRNSTAAYSRKRISFDVVYGMIYDILH